MRKTIAAIAFIIATVSPTWLQKIITPKKAEIALSVPAAAPLFPASDTVTMVVIGDVMMHATQLNYDCTEFLEPLRPMLEGADIAVANMEFTLGGEPYTGYPCFSSPDKYAQAVADLGVDVFLTANNHIRDRAVRGFNRTLDVYESMEGIRYTGTAHNAEMDTLCNPLIFMSKGIRFAIVNCSYGTNAGIPEVGYPSVRLTSKEVVSKDIERAKRAGADFIIAMPHWGNENQHRHCATQEKFAKWLAEQGVDAVVGAHPHVVQDTSHIAGMPVIYSMGNAVSNMTKPNQRLELAVTMRFVTDHDKNMEMLEPELTFIWCTIPGTHGAGFHTIRVDEYLGTREEWIKPADYDLMLSTLEAVKAATGIK